MKQKRLGKRIAVWFLCLAMVLTTINLPAFTTAVRAEDEPAVTFTYLDGAPAGFSKDENPNKVVDGDTSTKWCASFKSSAYIILKASQEVQPTGYRITTGNDTDKYSERNPKKWTLYASNNYDTETEIGDWTAIDTILDGQLPAEKCKPVVFNIDYCDTRYQYYKWEIEQVAADDKIQVGEFSLSWSLCEHSFVKTDEKKEATCVKGGYDVEQCSICHIERKVANDQTAKGHQFEEGICSVCGFDEHPSITAFATKAELVNPDIFTLHKENGTGVAQKVNFGNGKTWYIAGAQGDELVLICDPKNSFGEKFFLAPGKYNDGNINNKKYEYESGKKEVFANHYGASDVREYLTGDALNAFTDKEKSFMTNPSIDNTSVNTVDRSIGTYSTSDKLYLAYREYNIDFKTGKSDFEFITVGTNGNSDSTLNDGIKIGLGDKGTSGSPYTLKSNPDFWLRAPYYEKDNQALYVYSNKQEIAAVKVDFSNTESKHTLEVVPVFHLKLSDVLFASTATAGTSDATLETMGKANAMTFRMNGTGKVSSTAVYDNDGVKVTKGGDNEYIYIQYKDNTGDQVWSKAITGDMNIYKDCLGVDSFEDCKIWIEKKNDAENLTYAVMATGIKGHSYAVDTEDENQHVCQVCGLTGTHNFAEPDALGVCSLCGMIEKTSVTGTITWDDNDDADESRPEQLQINLLANGTQIDSKTLTADAKGDWSWTIEDLDKYANGVEVDYTIEQEDIHCYDTVVEGTTITNTISHEYVFEDLTKTGTKVSGATCIQKAKYHRVCYCGLVSTSDDDIFEYGDALGHNLVSISTTVHKCFRCDEQGEHDFSNAEYLVDDAGKHYQVCIICHGESAHVAHSGGTATCQENAKCSVCKKEYTTDSINHVNVKTVGKKDATCVNPGYTGDTYCSDCDTKLADGEEIAATGHDMTKVVSAKVDATCEADGKEVVMGCKNCDHEAGGAVITAKGHTWDAGEITTAATCKNKGVKTFKCTVTGCTGTKTEEIDINASNHVNTEVIGKKDATCTQNGYTGDTHCKDCGTKLADGEEIAATGIHSYAFGICVMCKKAFSFVKDGLEYTIVTEKMENEDGSVSTVPKEVTTKDSEGNKVTSIAVSVKADQDADVKGAVTIPATITDEDMPFTVVAVEENAFAKTEATSITLPETITEVGAGAFASETITEVAFTSVNAPTIDEKAFVGSKVTKVTVPEGAKDYDTQEALKSETIKVEEDKEPVKEPEQKPDDTTGKPDSTTQKPSTTTETPADDKKPGDTTKAPAKAGDAVKDDTGVSYTVADVDKKTVVYTAPVDQNVKSVKVPDTVTINGVSYAVTEVAANAFSGCTKLKSVTIGKNVVSIGANAFKNCKALTKLTLPAKVAKIGANAFSGCKKLKTLTIKNKKLKDKDINKKAFKGLTKATTIKVPKKQLKSYKKMFKKKGLSSKVKVKA